MRAQSMRLAATVLLAGAALAGTAVPATAVPAAAVPATATPGAIAPAAVASDICYFQVRGVYDWLNVRSGPGTNYSIIGRLYQDQYVLGDCTWATGPGATYWMHVNASGKWGWASRDYLALMP